MVAPVLLGVAVIAAPAPAPFDGGLIPGWLKVAYTLFLCVLVPVYAVRYGPANFLWFSDIALLVTALGLWLESSLLLSTMAVGVLLPEAGWNASFFLRLATGRRFLGLSDYMFDRGKSRFLRALSLFHVALPVVLLWAVARLGYDPRAWPAQTLVAAVVLPVTYFRTDPKRNINWVFGPWDKLRSRVPPLVYLAGLLAAFALGIYLPTHLLLRAAF